MTQFGMHENYKVQNLKSQKKRLDKMRRRFGKILNELANEDKKIILIVGDIGYGIFDDFRKIIQKDS